MELWNVELWKIFHHGRLIGSFVVPKDSKAVAKTAMELFNPPKGAVLIPFPHLKSLMVLERD
ncbi:MAG: hypothetical protein DRN26_01095 [Thermoplasmata archaeon]|nr:MAG: hypothetical protein DRN26_01095 [Thermoplasmata archaeon]